MKKLFFTLIILSLIVIVSGCAFTKDRELSDIISPEEAKAKAEEFINNYLVDPGNEAIISNIEDSENYSDYYKVIVDTVNTKGIESLISKDGKKFIMRDDSVNMEEYAQEVASQAGQTAQAEIPKSDNPKVELFVMAFCPYGVQAEASMAPVFDLLRDKVNINIRYIAGASGNELSSISSLHGNIEGVEDARQLCIAKNYSKKQLWDYVSRINKDCYPIYNQGGDVYKSCWEKSAKGAGLNVDKINICLSDEGVELIKADSQLANQYGVSGSPSLIINGVIYSGGRTPEAYKQAICSAFNNQPEECGIALDDSSGDVNGGC